MTTKQLAEMNDRDRIKKFIEAAMRELCDDMCQQEIENKQVLDFCVLSLKDLSQIYKNMGFDKAGVRNEQDD